MYIKCPFENMKIIVHDCAYENIQTMCKCIKEIKCNVLGSMYTSPMWPIILCSCKDIIQTLVLHDNNFKLNLTVYYYKINNIEINGSFKYMNQLT